MFKIFPATLINGRKVPLINDWQSLATTDPNQIKIWQEQFRERIAFWGVPTGSTNGIFALDIDIKTNGWDTIQKNGFQIPQTLSQRTLNGGSHFVFRYPNDQHIGQRVGFLPGLDIRGEGGWIAMYQFDNNPINEAPAWLYESIKEKPMPTGGTAVTMVPEIARSIFNDAINAIRNATEGHRNHTLNTQAYVVGQLIQSGAISEQEGVQALTEASQSIGLEPFETQATIRSGIKGGKLNPIRVELPPQEIIPVIPIEAPPVPPEQWTPAYATRAEIFDFKNLKKPQIFEHWSSEDIALTVADGGTGKSTLVLNEAIALALGIPFLGFEPRQIGRTLIITGEDSEAKLKSMVGAVLKQMGLAERTPENDAKVDQVLQSILIKRDVDLCLVTKDRAGFLHLDKKALEKILITVNEFKPKMIIFDPIASFWGSEAALNDMAKAVAKFCGELQRASNAQVHMLNHAGKDSSKSDDLTQFSGRGGTGLPSHARIVRTLKGVNKDKFKELTGTELGEKQSAMLCNVGKYSDGSPLLNEPFLIVREGYMFTRRTITPQEVKRDGQIQHDQERIMQAIKEMRRNGRYPTKPGLIGYFMASTERMSKQRVDHALALIHMTGLYGEFIKVIENPNPEVRDRAYIITDASGLEL